MWTARENQVFHKLSENVLSCNLPMRFSPVVQQPVYRSFPRQPLPHTHQFDNSNTLPMYLINVPNQSGQILLACLQELHSWRRFHWWGCRVLANSLSSSWQGNHIDLLLFASLYNSIVIVPRVTEHQSKDLGDGCERIVTLRSCSYIGLCWLLCLLLLHSK